MVAASAGSQVLFAAGRTGLTRNRVVDTVDLYDSATGEWTTAQLSQPRDSPEVATVAAQVLFVGGSTDQGFSDVDDIYDSASATWSVAHLSQANFYHRAC